MPWLELQLTLDATLQPRAEDALERLGALAVTLMDADADTPDEAAIFEPGVGETPLWRSITLTALFAADARRDALVAGLGAVLPQLSPRAVTFREVADQNWERAWMDRYHPMRFGRRLWIYPWNIKPPANREPAPHPLPSPAEGRGGERVALRADASNALPRGPALTPALSREGRGRQGVALRATDIKSIGARVIVRLDPGLAFGTGTHPTTALCLDWLDGLELAGKTLIDYGCGSGVLAIAALALGAARAIAVDNDPQALTATRENARRNGVADRLRVCAPADLPADARADVFVANILAGPLAALAPRFAALCRPRARLALSGILADQADELLQRYGACGFDGLHATGREGWVRIDGERSAASRTQA